MANKVPVGATLARAYGFAFGNIVNNLGAVWIPAAILYGLLIAFAKPYSAAMTTMVSHDPQAILRLMPHILLGYAIGFVLVTAQFAMLTKEALGIRKGSAWLQFPFGAPTWRLLLAYLALFLVTIILYIACILAVVILGGAAGLVARQHPGVATAAVVGLFALVLALATFCALFYCVVRLAFLMAPVAVAEGRRTLQRSWELTHGNFWRVFLVLLAIMVPFIILECAYFYWMFGPDFFSAGIGARSQDALAAWRVQEQAIVVRSVQRLQQYWFIAYPVGFAVALVLYGMLAGASAFAYRALTAGAAPETPASEPQPA
jgi:lysylphosphatidylglycerol synthetase-like protein (DUF2156 family)